jgi:hypothetical protein
MSLLWTAIAGFLTGVTASMGLGGGFVLIIFLTVFAGTAQVAAGGINLLFFLPIALISMYLHHKNKLIEWKLVAPICIAGAAGVAGGALLLGFVNEDLLRKLFSGLLVFVGLREIFHKKVDAESKS